jgi:hypothetical protein
MGFIRAGMIVGVCFFGIAALAFDMVAVPMSPFQLPKLEVELDGEPVTCAQFDGSWSGVCEGPEGKKDLEMVFEQRDCSLLIIDGRAYPLNGMATSANSHNAEMTNSTMALAWDADKTKIIGNGQTMGQFITKRRIIKYQHKNKFTLERDRQRILLTTEFVADTFVNDVKKVEKGEVSCRLEKKVETKIIK